ncbi:MAG: hypothetical protein WD032_05685 [Nitrospirales bacterium]
MNITRHRRSEIAASLDRRTFFKIARFLPLHDLEADSDAIMKAGVTTFQAMLPIITL